MFCKLSALKLLESEDEFEQTVGRISFDLRIEAKKT